MINKGILEGQNQKYLQMLDHAACMCDGHMRRSEGKGTLLRQFNSKFNKLSYFPVNPTSKWKGGTGEWKSCENIFQLAWIISYTRLFVFTTFQSTAAPHCRQGKRTGRETILRVARKNNRSEKKGLDGGSEVIAMRIACKKHLVCVHNSCSKSTRLLLWKWADNLWSATIALQKNS